MVGAVKELERACLQVVVDTCGSYAFGKFYTSKFPETATDILYDKVLPFCEEQKLAVENVLTDNGREYRGTSMVCLYQIFLEVYGIDHRTTKVTTPRINGFAERFNRTILDEFFREAFRNKLYLSLEERQADPMHGFATVYVEEGKRVKAEIAKKVAQASQSGEGPTVSGEWLDFLQMMVFERKTFLSHAVIGAIYILSP